MLSILYMHMSRSQADEAIQLLDDFHISNDMFKEHLLDLCLSRKAKEAFEKLSTQQKTAFTKAYNKEHKDPTAGKKGKKTAAKDDIVSDSDEENDKNLNIDEDEMAEIKRAKQRERERLQAKAKEKVESYELIKPVLKGDEAKAKGKPAAAKKGKAQTQKAKKKGGKNNETEDSLDGFIVDDDDEDAVKPKRGGKKAKTAKGKK